MKRITLKVQDPIVWEYPYMGAMNANRLAKGNTIINEAFADRVIEVTSDKKIVWMYGAISSPAGMERLENGNTLISVFGENRVIEIAAP